MTAVESIASMPAADPYDAPKWRHVNCWGYAAGLKPMPEDGYVFPGGKELGVFFDVALCNGLVGLIPDMVDDYIKELGFSGVTNPQSLPPSTVIIASFVCVSFHDLHFMRGIVQDNGSIHWRHKLRGHPPMDCLWAPTIELAIATKEGRPKIEVIPIEIPDALKQTITYFHTGFYTNAR